VAQDLLDMPYGDIGFQEMCCVGMSKDMGMNMFFKAQAFQCALQNPLNAAVAYMVSRKPRIFSTVVTQSRKNPFGIEVGFEIPAIEYSYQIVEILNKHDAFLNLNEL
jgi:hypothetical protein